MVEHIMLLEFKHRRLTRPMLDMIVGSALRTHPDLAYNPHAEILVRCRDATRTVYDALEDYPVMITIVTDYNRRR